MPPLRTIEKCADTYVEVKEVKKKILVFGSQIQEKFQKIFSRN